MPGPRGSIGFYPNMQNPMKEYSQPEESQFRQNLSFQLQFIYNAIDNVSRIKTKSASAAAFRHEFMLRRSS